jgi:hypothetical protein
LYREKKELMQMQPAGIDDVFFSDSVKMCGYFSVFRGRAYVKVRTLTDIGCQSLANRPKTITKTLITCV